MLSWLSSIGDAIGIFVQLVSSFVNGLIQLFVIVPQAVSFLTVGLAYIPPVLLAFAVAGIGITVFLMILGR